MIVFAGSTVCISSQTTRYGLSGASFEVSSGFHSAIQPSRTSVISRTTAELSRGASMLWPSSPSSASSVSPASPSRAATIGRSLPRWLGSLVFWTIFLPFGNLMPKFVSVNEQPMPMIRSALAMK